MLSKAHSLLLADRQIAARVSPLIVENKNNMLTPSNLSVDWKKFYQSLPGNDEGNQNLPNFTTPMGEGNIKEDCLKALTKDINSTFIGADASKNIMIFHSMINFGGTRTQKTNKIAALIGFVPMAVCVSLYLMS